MGERQPVWSTGLGKALILDLGEARWRDFYRVGEARGAHPPRDLDTWLTRMRDYAERGIAFDHEENEPEVRCVAAPIRDASGAIVAGLSVSSTAQYMDAGRMEHLTGEGARHRPDDQPGARLVRVGIYRPAGSWIGQPLKRSRNCAECL